MITKRFVVLEWPKQGEFIETYYYSQGHLSEVTTTDPWKALNFFARAGLEQALKFYPTAIVRIGTLNFEHRAATPQEVAKHLKDPSAKFLQVFP